MELASCDGFGFLLFVHLVPGCFHYAVVPLPFHHFGRVTCPDVLLAMSQEAANKYTKDCGKDSIVITDSLFVTEVPGTYKERIDLPITHTAIGACGKSLFANIVALGAVVALTHCVSEEALEKAVLNRVPKGTEEANKKALQAGKELITKR